MLISGQLKEYLMSCYWISLAWVYHAKSHHSKIFITDLRYREGGKMLRTTPKRPMLNRFNHEIMEFHLNFQGMPNIVVNWYLLMGIDMCWMFKNSEGELRPSQISKTGISPKIIDGFKSLNELRKEPHFTCTVVSWQRIFSD